MSRFHDDGQVTLYQGDVRAVLRGLPAESVHCVVTSPPYWSLRDYGIEPSVWGGDEHHIHDWESTAVRREMRTGLGLAELGERYAGGGHKHGQIPAVEFEHVSCSCGAWRGALGLEPTPGLFIAHMVDVFREVRRVLRPEGTLWLNIGDSYAGSWGAQGRQGETGQMATRSVISARQIDAPRQRLSGTGSTANMPGIKPKDLVGIPWMLAFALRADGWWLRQDIIWAKPNPMPESVTDRCTKAHEYVFLLSKSARYWYDAAAIADIATHAGQTKTGMGSKDASDPERQRTLVRGERIVGDTRNKRSVWTVATAPFAEAHFATYPPDLVRPCILAGCPEGGTVLDPFIGSGTTAMVARQMGRRAIGIDLNPEYLAMAARRIGQPIMPALMPSPPSEAVMRQQLSMFEGVAP